MCVFFFFFKQKTAYEMRISDWSSDVCSSDLALDQAARRLRMIVQCLCQPCGVLEFKPVERTTGIDRRAVFHRAPATDAVVVFERQASRIHDLVTTGA